MRTNISVSISPIPENKVQPPGHFTIYVNSYRIELDVIAGPNAKQKGVLANQAIRNLEKSVAVEQ